MDKELTVKLVKAMQAGDQNAAGQLYESCYQDIYYFILKTVKEKELAEDLTQDTFIKIMENIRQLQEPEAFQGWSRQIAYHSCTAYFRKHKELLMDENEDGGTVFDTMEEENAEFIPHEALDKEDLKKTILAMLDSLPQEQRAAMVLRYYEELPVSQIAKIQGVSEGTVKSRLNYGRNAVRKSVEAYEKKNGVKLHSFAILPLLLWLFRKQKLSQGKSITAKTGAAGGSAAGASKAASKGFFSTLGGKITAAVLAVAVVGGGIAAAIGLAGNSGSESKDKDRERGSSWQEPDGVNTLKPNFSEEVSIHDYISTLVLTDQAVPEGVETEDVSQNGDGSVLIWLEGDTMYVTTADGGTLYAPVDSNHLFSNHDFENKSRLKRIVFDNFDTRYTKNMELMFFSCESLETLDLSGWDVSNVTSTIRMFAYCNSLKELDLSGWKLHQVTEMFEMFSECTLLETVDVSNWDVSKVDSMRWLFLNCCNMKEVDLSKWDVSNVENMEGMFAGCCALETVDVSRWDVSKATTMATMFDRCKSLKTLDVSKWDVSNVESMFYMFNECSTLETLDVSGWDVSKVTDMLQMFRQCVVIDGIDVSGWDVSKVTRFDHMFRDCFALSELDLSGWNPPADATTEGMLLRCEQLPESLRETWK